MCDNCKCEEAIDNEQLEITEEQLMQMLQSNNKPELTYYREPIEFEDENMGHMVNSAEFIKGQSDATYWVGYWNTLLNGGIPEELSIEILLAQQLNNANKVIQKMNVGMNIEMSKNQLIVAEKNQL